MQRVLFVIAMMIGLWVFFSLSSQEVWATTVNEWFMTYTGDVHGEDGITNDRPTQLTSTACDTILYPPYMSAVNDSTIPAMGDAGIMSGIVSHNGSFTGGCVVTDPAGAVSQTFMSELQQSYATATTLTEVKNEKLYYGYEYYINHIPADLFPSTSTNNNLTNGDINTGTYFKFNPSSGVLNVEQLNIGSTDKKVVLVNGFVTIEHPIKVAQDGFFALIAKEDITIYSKHGGSGVDGTPADPDIQGVYIADGSIITSSRNNPNKEYKNMPCNGSHKDKTLFAAGIFIGWNGISLQRELAPECVGGGREGSDHIKTPAEVFIYRPDFLLSAPKEFMDRPYLFTEIKP